jgi:hypothetical protein
LALPASIALSALFNVIVLVMVWCLRFTVTGVVTCEPSCGDTLPFVQ